MRALSVTPWLPVPAHTLPKAGAAVPQSRLSAAAGQGPAAIAAPAQDRGLAEGLELSRATQKHWGCPCSCRRVSLGGGRTQALTRCLLQSCCSLE